MNDWIWTTLMIVGMVGVLITGAVIFYFGVKKAQATPVEVTYQIKGVRMKGDGIILEPGWKPFGMNQDASVIFIIKEVNEDAQSYDSP